MRLRYLQYKINFFIFDYEKWKGLVAVLNKMTYLTNSVIKFNKLICYVNFCGASQEADAQRLPMTYQQFKITKLRKQKNKRRI